MWIALMLSVCFADEAARPPRADETIIFFDGAAALDPTGERWVLPIHFWAFEPERDSHTRALTLDLLEDMLDIDDASPAQRRLFNQRAAWFLVDNERQVRPRIRLGGEAHLLTASAENGHSITLLNVPSPKLPGPRGEAPVWVRYDMLDAGGAPARTPGGVLLIPPEGISVISDIDDTIRMTHVQDMEATFRSTFLNEFQPVPGMAELYRQWQRCGAAFHYVSSSPYQLYTPIITFMEGEGFPRGGMQLKLVRMKDSSLLNLFEPARELKGVQVDRILRTWPRRRFILVGDSAEEDAEIYGDLARKYPGRVARIYIRSLDGKGIDSRGHRRALRDLPEGTAKMFHDPATLREDAAELFDGTETAVSRPAHAVGGTVPAR